MCSSSEHIFCVLNFECIVFLLLSAYLLRYEFWVVCIISSSLLSFWWNVRINCAVPFSLKSFGWNVRQIRKRSKCMKLQHLHRLRYLLIALHSQPNYTWCHCVYSTAYVIRYCVYCMHDAKQRTLKNRNVYRSEIYLQTISMFFGNCVRLLLIFFFLRVYTFIMYVVFLSFSHSNSLLFICLFACLFIAKVSFIKL